MNAQAGLAPTVTGKTLCYPLIGFPVAQVRTPPGINAWFLERGIDATMFGMDIAPDVVGSFFSVLRGWGNCGGCSVTVPHKQAAFAVMDTVSDRTKRVGAVNIVRREEDGRLVGDMTDGLAFVEALKRKGTALIGKTALIAGAGGGAGAAIADSLCDAGVREIILLEPDTDRRGRVRTMLRSTYPHVTVSDTAPADRLFDLAINASPAGMGADDRLPFEPDRVRADGIVADIVTKPDITPLIAAARQAGRMVQTGIEMADAQLEFQMRHLNLWHNGKQLSPAEIRV